jgi:hypothetical protein
MFCRDLPLKPGDQAKTRVPYSSFSLPDGLAPGTTVTILIRDCDYTVEDENGKQWRLPYQCIEHQSIFEVTPGHWVPRSDPRVTEYLARWKRIRAEDDRRREEAEGPIRPT